MTDYENAVELIADYLIDEGFVRQKNGTREAEKHAKRILAKLHEANLFLVAPVRLEK